MTNYRDPKVTPHGRSRMRTWIIAAIAVLVVLILLSWFMGGTDEAEVTTIPEDPAATEPVETAPAEPVEPAEEPVAPAE